jgi:hypothetical protein
MPTCNYLVLFSPCKLPQITALENKTMFRQVPERWCSLRARARPQVLEHALCIRYAWEDVRQSAADPTGGGGKASGADSQITTAV